LVRRRRATATFCAAALAVVALLGSGCKPTGGAGPDLADSGSASATEGQRPSEAPIPAGPDNPLDRRATAPVPAGFPVTDLEFVDVDEGYALFQRCDQPRACRVALAVTLDGGNSWIERPLPFTPQSRVALRVGLTAGAGNLLLLRAEPIGWFVSRDSGRSFEQRPLQPPPLEVNLTGPRYVHRCPSSNPACPAPRPVLAIGGDGAEAVRAAIPPVGNLTGLQADGDGTKLWAVGRQAGTVLLAVSADQGQSWTPAGAIPLGATAPSDPPILAVSSSGADVWLAGDGYGFRRAADGRWSPVPAMQDATDLRSAVALGHDVLLLAGTRGASTVTGDRWVPDAPPEVAALRDLGGGVVQGYVVSGSADTVWLCRCDGTDRQWIRVAVMAP
jgi:hypothetical protein